MSIGTSCALSEIGWAMRFSAVSEKGGSDPTSVESRVKQGVWKTFGIHGLQNVSGNAAEDFGLHLAVSENKRAVETWNMRTATGKLLANEGIAMPELLGAMRLQFELGHFLH